MQKVAWILIGLGILVVIGYASKGFFTAADIPLAFRVAAGIVGLGLVLLLVSVGKERYQTAKKESFKEIER